MSCQICGKPSGYYPLCPECFKLKDEGIVIKCPECGTWRRTDKKCPECNDPVVENLKSSKNSSKSLIEENTSNLQKSNRELTCIICGAPSNGLHFCKACYAKYKDRAVDIRIHNCTKTEILDEYGNKIYKCDDGRWVRSRAEAMICSWLFHQKIRVMYEETVYYKDEKTGEPKELHPDFFLPDYNLYIEYNELTNPKYVETKEYVKKIYEKLKLHVIVMTDKDLQDVAACLKPQLLL